MSAQSQPTYHDVEVDNYRKALRKGLRDAQVALDAATVAVNELASNRVYDVEVAEGPHAAIVAALTQAAVGLAAAEHLTRGAEPFLP